MTWRKSILWAHHSGMTWEPHSYLAFSPWCMWTVAHFAIQGEKLQLLCLKLLALPTQFCCWGNQAPGICVPLINWVYSYHGIVHSLLVNGGGSLQILRVVATNVLNGWLQTSDRAVHHLGSWCNWHLVSYTGPQTWTFSLGKLAVLFYGGLYIRGWVY